MGCAENSVNQNPTENNLNIADTSTSIKDSLNTTIEIPVGLKISDSVFKQIRQITPWGDFGNQIKIITLNNINNQVFYVSYIIENGVCSINYIMTFSKNKYKDHEILSIGTDSELSYPRYEYSELRRVSSNGKFTKVNFIQTPIDESTVDEKTGWFKEGFSLDNVDIKTDSLAVDITVVGDGRIMRDTLR